MPEGVGYGPQNTASIGKDIHVIGNHAYAFSGTITNAGAASYTALSFTTGNYYFVGQLSAFGWLDDINQSQGKQCLTAVKINNNRAILIKTDGSSEAMPSTGTIDILIPSYTLIEVALEAFEADSNTYAGATLTGRIYK